MEVPVDPVERRLRELGAEFNEAMEADRGLEDLVEEYTVRRALDELPEVHIEPEWPED